MPRILPNGPHSNFNSRHVAMFSFIRELKLGKIRSTMSQSKDAAEMGVA